MDRYGMAISPPAYVDRDALLVDLRPNLATVRALARHVGLPEAEVWARVDQTSASLADALLSSIRTWGWPDDVSSRRQILRAAIEGDLGLASHPDAARRLAALVGGRPYYYAFLPDTLQAIRPTLSFLQGRRVFPSTTLYWWMQGDAGLDGLSRRISAEPSLRSEAGTRDPAYVVGPLVPMHALPSRGVAWRDPVPSPADAAVPSTMPRAAAWREVAPPVRAGSDRDEAGGGGLAVLLVLAMATTLGRLV